MCKDTSQSINLAKIVTSYWQLSIKANEIMAPITQIVQKANSALEEFKKTEKFQALQQWAAFSVSIQKTGIIIEHPILQKNFPAGFCEEDLEKNWGQIRRSLWQSRPKHITKIENRDERYNQLLKAQTAKAFIAVCRGTYPEIERLLRETLFLDPLKKQAFANEKSKREQESFISQSLRDLRTIDNNPWNISSSASLQEVGMFAASVIDELEKCFEGFAPVEVLSKQNGSLQTRRHYHSHGWSDHATFIDGLNALFLFDGVMQLAAQSKIWQTHSLAQEVI